MGAVGYVLVSSFLIRENILALVKNYAWIIFLLITYMAFISPFMSCISLQITINIHASLSYLLTAIGVNTVPSMNTIYAIFGTLVPSTAFALW